MGDQLKVGAKKKQGNWWGTALIGLVIIFGTTTAQGQVEGYPILNNKLIGTFNLVQAASTGPVDEFEFIYWARELLDSFASSGDAMGPLRYVIAFSSYGVAQTVAHTPAYREPYRVVMKALISKMLYHASWSDWLEHWGDDPRGPDNIMYTGHLFYMMTLYRQAFNDQVFEENVTLTNPGGPEFVTDVKALAVSIHKQAMEYVDASGAHTYNIACEPGRIFVPCNLPHHLAQLSYDQIYGSQYQNEDKVWLEWIKTKMFNPEHGVLYDLYFPFGSGRSEAGDDEPMLKNRLSGVYNGWSIWMLHAMDKEWVTELYQNYKQYFVVRGEDSPEEDGRTMVVDRSGLSGLAQRAMDTIATGFGLIAAKHFSDKALFDELLATWTLIFGEPQWSEGGLQFVHSAPLYPLMFQNGFILVAKSISKDINLTELAHKPWEPDFFEQPFIEKIEPSTLFVNQAFYDNSKEKLIVTVNGGEAYKGSVTLHVANLDKKESYWVRRNGETYDAWKWKGKEMQIKTPPLSATMESYTIEKGNPNQDEGCACSSHRRATNFELLVLCFGLWLLKRFCRKLARTNDTC